MQKKTKILATIGPATSEPKVLASLIKNGVDVMRLNFSHGDAESIEPLFKAIRKAEEIAGRRVAVLQDLGGPKIRTGDFVDGSTILKKGKKVKIFTKKMVGNDEAFSVSYKRFLDDVKVGHRILLNDGNQELKVVNSERDFLEAKVINGGFIRNRRGVNLPDSDLSISSLTKKDKEDMKFAIKHGLEFVAVSFVKNAKDVLDTKKLLKKGRSNAMVIAKIETPGAVENFDEILEVADAIMVARGDMAVEVDAEKVPTIQKMIIRRCNAVGKPVITATQMMESMIENPVPTRAEVSDISNAILDGSDAVMLSAETSVGKFALESVKMMTKVALETESHLWYEKFVSREYTYKDKTMVPTVDAITRYAAKTAYDIDAKVIVALTESGSTGRMISRYKTKNPIYIFSPNQNSLMQSRLSFGTYFGENADYKGVREAIEGARKYFLKNKIAKKGDKIVLVAGIPFKTVGGTNTVSVFEI